MKEFFWGVVQQITLAVSLFLVMYVFLVQPHQVDGRSMEPNFWHGEYLLTDKISYFFSTPQRGDVVVFSAPPSRREDYIKRVVGLPGETVSIHDGKVFINNQMVDEKYLPLTTDTTDNSPITNPLTLRKDEYFVMGDNRNASHDSRSFGAIKRRDIVGRAWLVYWPPTQIRIITSLAGATIR